MSEHSTEQDNSGKGGENAGEAQKKIPGYPNLTPFPPGGPGGPGRPPGRKNLKTLAREALAIEAPRKYREKLEEMGFELPANDLDTLLLFVAIGKAASGSVHHLREVWDRRDGKARQAIDIDAKSEHRILIGLPPVAGEGDENAGIGKEAGTGQHGRDETGDSGHSAAAAIEQGRPGDDGAHAGTIETQAEKRE